MGKRFSEYLKEGRIKPAKDVGLECMECGKKFRSKNPRYGSTKCPKCKSTDLDLAFGESVDEASTFRKRKYSKKNEKSFGISRKKDNRKWGEGGYRDEEVEIEEGWAVIDTAKRGEVMAVSSDEKRAHDSVRSSTISKYDYHYGKDPKTLKVVKVKGKYSQKKAERMIGTKLPHKEEFKDFKSFFKENLIIPVKESYGLVKIGKRVNPRIPQHSPGQLVHVGSKREISKMLKNLKRLGGDGYIMQGVKMKVGDKVKGVE